MFNDHHNEIHQGKLKGKKIAILATDGFEESELFEPKAALEKAGAEVQIVSIKTGSIKAWNKTDWGQSINVDALVSEVHASDYDALVLPGGVMNPDHLLQDEDAIQFAMQFMVSGKPIGAICHGPWLLVETGILYGRKVTSWPSIKTDLLNAGAKWFDQEVVVDQGLITSRKPADIPAFCEKLIEEIVEGRHSPFHRRPLIRHENAIMT
ncbi:MAG: type 1 glutamine amidotransferase [Bdellovibrionaceae bacterium]|nr:type 1 glutamine amidotransferase [Bdellovibrio sp.]